MRLNSLTMAALAATLMVGTAFAQKKGEKAGNDLGRVIHGFRRDQFADRLAFSPMRDPVVNQDGLLLIHNVSSAAGRSRTR